MADALLAKFEQKIDGLLLIPSSGGVFEVTVGDELVYSKKATGEHAIPAEVIDAVRRILA